MAFGKALDYSAKRLTGAQIKAAGYVAAIRYLPKPDPSDVATLTQAEYADLTGHGLHVAVVFEHNDRLRPLQGHTAGVQDAQWARQVAAQEGIPVPPRSIYMAHDIWEENYRTGSGLAAMRAYQAGAHSVLGESAAVYGYTEIVQAAKDDGTAFKFWQCGRESDLLAHVNVYQQNYGQVTVGGITCDVNRILTADYGQHPGPEPDPADTHNDQELDTMVLFGMARLSQDGPDGKKGDVFKVCYLNNTYAKIPTPAILKEVNDVHARNYAPGQVLHFDTANMDRFGTEVKWGQL